MNFYPLLSAPRTAALALVSAAALTACGGSGTDATVELRLTGLGNLGPNAVYEGWLIVNGAPVTTGRFTVNDAGVLSQTRFPVTRAQADGSSTFILTIEPAQNDVPAPSAQHLVAGDFDSTKTTANVNTAHAAALGTDFRSAAGRFFLATPTSASTDDEAQGIWFLQMGNNGPEAALTIPALPTGWAYEGWVVVNGQPVSTGRFTSATGPDSDGKGPAAGPLGGPPFPGQDFITPPLSLPGGAAVISLEPEPDNSPAPFDIKPLVLASIANATGPGNLQTLGNTVVGGAGLPAGTVQLLR